MAPSSKLLSWERTLIVAIFFGACWAPMILMLGRPGRAISTAENRTLARMPRLTGDLSTWAAFPDEFKKYFRDNFGFRDRLVEVQAWVKVRGLGMSTSPDVVVGKDGWLFYTGFGALDIGLQPLSQAQMEKWAEAQRGRRDWLATYGSCYYIVVVPEKSTIYPEYLPESVRSRRRTSRLAQLTSFIRKYHPDLQWIDLTQPLLENKAMYPRLYNKTDTHWNAYGAFVAYHRITQELSARFPAIRPLALEDCIVGTVRRVCDLSSMLGLTSWNEDDYTLRSRNASAHFVAQTPSMILGTTSKPGLPKAVVSRDSFFNQFGGLLAEHFNRILFEWDYRLDATLVRTERPDVVIAEMAERTLTFDPPPDPSFGPPGPVGGGSTARVPSNPGHTLK